MELKKRKAIDSLANTFREFIFNQNDDNCYLEGKLEARGIRVKYFDDEKYDAFLEWNKELGSPIISVNLAQPSTRQFFSIAHELGHLVLDWKWIPGNDLSETKSSVLSVKYRGADNYTEKESESEVRANEFAAAFLMPDTGIENLLKNTADIPNNNFEGIAMELSRKYSVSREAASIRLSNYLFMRDHQ